MDHLTIVDTFRYPTKTPQNFIGQIERMKELAIAYNFYDHKVKLCFLGDEKSGVRFRVESGDPATKTRIETALKQFALQQKTFSL